MNERLLGMTQAQRDRLAFIDLSLRYRGELGRQDLVARFGIQSAAATRDLAQYREVAPKNLDYDTKAKAYIRAVCFCPLFEFPVKRVLNWLSEGYGDGEPIRWRSIAAQEGASLLGRIDLELLSVLTRAIHRGAAVEVAYRALSDGLTTREIVPFALVDSGLHWHIRAFDRRIREFGDFVVGRFDAADILPGLVAEEEKRDQDIQWNRITDLKLVPHPSNVKHPDTIEAEYGMDGGVLKVRTRAAMAGYLLRHWNVDCTENHSLNGGQFHLWLRNRQALYGVTNLLLAPGYDGQSNE